MYYVGIITASDKGYNKARIDKSGKIISDIVERNGYGVNRYIVLPDDKEKIKDEITYMCDTLKLNLILTTGGTGFSERDVTPEATREVIEREAPGISESIRAFSMTITKRAMLSRGVSGIRGKTLIINLPGSPKAVTESLEFIISELGHGISILTGKETDCAK